MDRAGGVNFYCDNEPFCAAWLSNLITDGYLPAGIVDGRSITDVRSADLAGYKQAHWFCGIGGWSLALKLAGWPDDEPVWTGSCPCQPFSVAGKRQAHEDARDLWPAFFRLIAQCRPPVIFGEQVAGAIAHGWLDRICDDLEREGYAVGATVLPASSVGAPHIRQRLYWVAVAQPQLNGGGQSGQRGRVESANGGALGHADAAGPQRRGIDAGERADQLAPWGTSQSSGMGNSIVCRPDRRHESMAGKIKSDSADGQTLRSSAWGDRQAIQCLDGKQRRIPLEPAFFPLVDGVSRNRVGVLRGAGNAIVPQVAAEFIKVVMEIIGGEDDCS